MIFGPLTCHRGGHIFLLKLVPHHHFSGIISNCPGWTEEGDGSLSLQFFGLLNFGCDDNCQFQVIMIVAI